MAEGTGVRSKRDGQIALIFAAVTYTVSLDPGDFTFTVPDAEVNLFLDRGVIGATPAIRLGNEAPVTGSFSAYLRDVGYPDATNATLPDAVFRFAGAYAVANMATTHSTSDVVTCTLTYTIDGSAVGETDRTLSFAFTVLRGSVAEGDPSVFSATYTAYIVRPTLA